ncbi:hypothetical protein HQ529_00940 [Candidatus Woesearchaeota archaeon]|nr:hypothetical protein [Candidatus Woesearchaeota archaeon]
MSPHIGEVVNNEVRLRNIERNSKKLMILVNKTSTNSEERELMIDVISNNLLKFRELTKDYVGKQIENAQRIYYRIQDYAKEKLNKPEYEELFST